MVSLKQKIKSYFNRVRDNLVMCIGEQHTLWHENNKDMTIQILLSMKYREFSHAFPRTQPLPTFEQVEFSSYSQNGEDGILLFIFSVIGATNKQVVEVCAGDGIECNAANLIINHGWSGLLFDGNNNCIERGKAFYTKRTNAWRLRRLPPTLIHAWITRDNINNLIENNGINGEIDLLSLDMDGVDFWIWKAINCISPRIVLCEYNNRWQPEQSVTVPYSDDFAALGASTDGEGYFGASLAAFTKLAHEKGYRLVGANSPNTNAFFMRNDIGNEFFPEVSVTSCLASAYAHHQHSTKYPLINKMSVIEI